MSSRTPVGHFSPGGASGGGSEGAITKETGEGPKGLELKRFLMFKKKHDDVDCYQSLGLSFQASQSDVRKGWLHTAKCLKKGSKELDDAKFSFDTLRSPPKRKAYDKKYKDQCAAEGVDPVSKTSAWFTAAGAVEGSAAEQYDWGAAANLPDAAPPRFTAYLSAIFYANDANQNEWLELEELETLMRDPGLALRDATVAGVHTEYAAIQTEGGASWDR